MRVLVFISETHVVSVVPPPNMCFRYFPPNNKFDSWQPAHPHMSYLIQCHFVRVGWANKTTKIDALFPGKLGGRAFYFGCRGWNGFTPNFASHSLRNILFQALTSTFSAESGVQNQSPGAVLKTVNLIWLRYISLKNYHLESHCFNCYTTKSEW